MLLLFSGVCADGSKSKGGGVITGTASEATLTALLTARSQAVTAFREQHKGADIDRQQVGWSKRIATASSFFSWILDELLR